MKPSLTIPVIARSAVKSGGGVAPSNTVAPVVSGTTTVGQTLSCTTGTWSGDAPITYSYQWKRGVTNVGTDSSTYVLVSGDIASNMSCTVTATNAAGNASQASNSVGPVLADIRASVGTSTSPTSTGTKAVTGVGFQPKVVLPFGAFVTDSTAATLSFGSSASVSSRAAISAASKGGVTTSVTSRRHANKALTLSYDGSLLLEADFSAFGADGFTLDWSTVLGVAFPLNHICLGGADLEVSLVQCQMNGTNAAQSFAHGLTGAPTGVLFFSAVRNNAPPATGGELLMSIGALAGANQFSAQVYSGTGLTTTSTRRALLTSSVLGYVDTASQRQMAFSSVDATNVNVTYPVTAATYQMYFWMLCIRGAKCQVGTFDPFAGATITTAGITPKLFLPVFLPTGVTQSGTVNNHLLLSIGASDGTNNVSCGISDENGQTTTDARRFQSSTSLALYDDGGTKQFEATAAFSGESVVLTRTTNVQYFGEMGYLVIGS